MTEEEKKKTKTLFLPWELPWDPSQPSWRDQSPLIMYAHTHTACLGH